MRHGFHAIMIFGMVLSSSSIPCVFAGQPNVVVILADDVGREVLESYGGSSYRTPQIDRLAEDGMRFTHAYVMPSCHPTRISLLSGQYPFRLGHPTWGTYPPAAETNTVAKLLKRTGYATAIAGKWQLGMLKDDLNQPHRMGFDEYCLFGWHEGPRYYQPTVWQNGKPRTDVRNRYGPDVYCEFLIDFIRRNKDRPFFAFYSMALCHDVTDDLAEPVPFGPRDRYDNYAEMVAAMDERVGRLTSAIDSLRLGGRTVILFLGDNGTPGRTIITHRDGVFVREPVFSQLGDRRIRGGKTKLTDWGTRVPCIARWPGSTAPRQVNNTLVDMSDFLPTLAELAGAELPAEVKLDGQSFARTLRNGTPGDREWVFAERKDKWFVKDRRYKLYNDGQFFDLDVDPDERCPLPTDGLAPDASAALDRLEQARDTMSEPTR